MPTGTCFRSWQGCDELRFARLIPAFGSQGGSLTAAALGVPRGEVAHGAKRSMGYAERVSFEIDEAKASLRRTPSVLRQLVDDASEAWLAARPAAGEWSAHQVACHLAYVEETDWLVRARMIREVGPMRPFPPVDHGDQTGRYAGLSTVDVASRFADLRAANLAALEAMRLDAADLDLRGLHPTLGEVTLRQLLATWVVHDHNHVAQLQGALAAYYAEEVGPWRSFLGILDPVRDPSEGARPSPE